MTSKEALKRLKQETAPATYMVDFDKDECIEIIRKDLERLEKLEERYKRRAEISNDLNIALKQYEKVLDFLVSKFALELKKGRLYFLYNNSYFELDKEKEELIKEVLE